MDKKRLFNVLTYDIERGEFTPEIIEGVETQAVDERQVMFVLGILSTVGYSCEPSDGSSDGSDGFTCDPSILVEELIDLTLSAG